jgi:hypothetical protein
MEVILVVGGVLFVIYMVSRGKRPATPAPSISPGPPPMDPEPVVVAGVTAATSTLRETPTSAPERRAGLAPRDDEDDDREYGEVDDDDVERRGVVWVCFVGSPAGAKTYPMPGVPRVGDFVNLDGPGAGLASPFWRVTSVVWVTPANFAARDLPTLTLSALPAVNVNVERVERKK